MDITLADWNLFRSFLAVAEEGSLSAAAQKLGLTQPTVGRHIRQLEASARSELFHRHTRGLYLTEAGAALLAPAREMQAAAGRLAVLAAGRGPSETGTVRISTSEMVACYHMPPIIAKLRQAAPGIEVELHATDATDNLSFREADIAVRMFRPTQLDLVTRYLGDIAMALYASQAYIGQNGLPEDPQALMEHAFIGFDRSELLIRGMRKLGFNVDRSAFAIRCDDQPTCWEMVRAGCGIGVGQKPIGDADPTLVAILPDLPMPSLPVWLTMPEPLRQTPRVRRVFDMLVDHLKPLTQV